MTIDWTKPICTDTTPPRRAKVVDGPDEITGNYQIRAAWHVDILNTRLESSLWCYPSGNCNLGSDFPRIRNVRPGDFPDAPDLAAELAESLRKLCSSHRAQLYPSEFSEAHAALAKYEASK